MRVSAWRVAQAGSLPRLRGRGGEGAAAVQLSQRLADLLRTPRGLGHQETDIRLCRDEAHALADEGKLALQIALAAKPGELAVLMRGRDGALDRRHHFRIPEGAGLAHGGEEIVAAHVDHVD